jgi:hypothetical protein
MRRERVSSRARAHDLARLRAGGARGRHVHDGGLVGIVDGGGDGAHAPALDLERALVARLPAGGGIEHGAVEHDAAALVDREHACGAVAQVGIGPVELLGHASSRVVESARPKAGSTHSRPH